MTLKQLLGLDTRADRYAYGVDPVAGYVSAQKMPDRWVSTTCGYCSVGCGMFIGVKDGRAVSVRGNPDHPVNRGMLCPKGLSEHHTISRRQPRAPPAAAHATARWQRVGWDEALDDDGGDVPRHPGSATAPGSVGVISTGQLVTEEFYALGKLVQLGLGTPNYDGNTTLCMSTAVAGYKRSFGSDGPPGAYEDLEHADVILLIGANIAENHPDPLLAPAGQSRHDAHRRRPARHQDGDAGRPAPADPAAHRSGALNGLIHIVIEHDLIDRDYIDAHTTGFEALRESVRDYTPGARRRDHRPDARADLPHGAGPTPTRQGRVHRLDDGRQPQHARAPRPSTPSTTWRCSPATSAAPARRRSRSPASATRWARARPASRRACPATASSRSAADREELAGIWNVPVERIPTARGLAYPDIIEAALDGRIRALWIIATNPIVSFPNLRRAAAGARRARVPRRAGRLPPDADHRARAPGAAGGDVGREGRHLHQLRAARQQGEPRRRSRPARRAPTSTSSWRSPTRSAFATSSFPAGRRPRDAFEEWKRVSAGRLCDYSGMTYEAIEQHGGIQWPFPAGATDPAARRGASTPTASSRPTTAGRGCCPTAWEPFPEQPTDDFPLVLNTGRTVEHWHTRTKTGKVPILERLSPNAWVEMNPRDARALRLKPQDTVDVVSRRGRVRGVELRVTETIAPGPGLRALPLRRGQRQRGDAERVRSDLARAELQAVGGARRARRPKERGTMKRLVVVGNGMAGMACVEQILKYAPQFAHHRLRRRDARQLQPRLLSSVLAGEKAADDIVINPREWYQQQRHRPARRRAHRRRRCRGEDGHRQRRQRHAVRHAAARHRQLRVACRRSTGSTRTACSSSARSTTRASCCARSGPAPRRWSSAAGCSGSRPRAACRCRAATSPSCT